MLEQHFAKNRASGKSKSRRKDREARPLNTCHGTMRRRLSWSSRQQTYNSGRPRLHQSAVAFQRAQDIANADFTSHKTTSGYEHQETRPLKRNAWKPSQNEPKSTNQRRIGISRIGFEQEYHLLTDRTPRLPYWKKKRKAFVSKVVT